MVYKGTWGNWLKWHKQPKKGYLACGMATKSVPNQGRGDDSAVNAVAFLYCNTRNWAQMTWGKYDSGLWGSWDRTSVCPRGYFIYHLIMKTEPSQGRGDDSAANKFAYKCKRKNTRTG